MEDKINFTVGTPQGTVFQKQVYYVDIPTKAGPVGIMNGHAPMLCAVETGVIRCKYADQQENRITLDDGIASVSNNEVIVLTRDAKIE